MESEYSELKTKSTLVMMFENFSFISWTLVVIKSGDLGLIVRSRLFMTFEGLGLIIRSLVAIKSGDLGLIVRSTFVMTFEGLGFVIRSLFSDFWNRNLATDCAMRTTAIKDIFSPYFQFNSRSLFLVKSEDHGLLISSAFLKMSEDAGPIVEYILVMRSEDFGHVISCF